MRVCVCWAWLYAEAGHVVLRGATLWHNVWCRGVGGVGKRVGGFFVCPACGVCVGGDRVYALHALVLVSVDVGVCTVGVVVLVRGSAVHEQCAKTCGC